MLEMSIFWDGRMLNYGLAGRSQNVLFNLYLLDAIVQVRVDHGFFFLKTLRQGTASTTPNFEW